MTAFAEPSGRRHPHGSPEPATRREAADYLRREAERLAAVARAHGLVAGATDCEGGCFQLRIRAEAALAEDYAGARR